MAGMDLELDGHSVRISHPDRIVFPAVGVTKGELVEHYRTVAPRMLPFLRGRPVSMQRVHDTIESQVFYQKAAPAVYPAWIHRVTVPKAGGTVTHAVCDDAATLVYLANQNCITPHVWLSRQPQLDKPDRSDRGSGSRAGGPGWRPTRCRVRADALIDAGLTPHPHGDRIERLPRGRADRAGETFDDVAELAWRFAAVLAGRSPDRLTTEFYKEKRGARVYLDMARNTWAQTAVPPYAVRVRVDRVRGRAARLGRAGYRRARCMGGPHDRRAVAGRRPVGRDRDTRCADQSAHCLGRAAGLGNLAAVRAHGEDVRDDSMPTHQARAIQMSRADRLLREQVADRVDDRCHRLVLGEGAHRAGHGLGGHEGRADERQEDERIGERTGTVRGRSRSGRG